MRRIGSHKADEATAAAAATGNIANRAISATTTGSGNRPGPGNMSSDDDQEATTTTTTTTDVGSVTPTTSTTTTGARGKVRHGVAVEGESAHPLLRLGEKAIFGEQRCWVVNHA